jgi:integrase/recombinase XerD
MSRKKQFPTIARTIEVEGFLLFKEASGRSHYTIKDYRVNLNRFCDWLNNPQIINITPNQIEEFFRYLQEDVRVTHVYTTPIKPRKLSPKTILNAWTALSSFWNWSSNEFSIENPFRIPRIKAEPTPIESLKEAEIELLLRVCDYAEESRPGNRSSFKSRRPTRKRDKAIILTLLDTGVRVSELCGINMKHLDLKNGRIYVTGKGKKARYVFIGKSARKALWGYLVERFPDEKPEFDEPVFVDKENFRRLSMSGVNQLLKRIAKRAGIENVHPHRFRHTFAIELLRNGGDLFTLQELLGHSSLDMVRRYVKLAQLDLEQTHRKASPVDNWGLR